MGLHKLATIGCSFQVGLPRNRANSAGVSLIVPENNFPETDEIPRFIARATLSKVNPQSRMVRGLHCWLFWKLCSILGQGFLLPKKSKASAEATLVEKPLGRRAFDFFFLLSKALRASDIRALRYPIGLVVVSASPHRPGYFSK